LKAMFPKNCSSNSPIPVQNYSRAWQNKILPRCKNIKGR
jgi:hypothetical protein